MNPLVFILDETDKGNVIIESKRFKEIVELCYEQGYQDGERSVTPLQSNYPTSSQTIPSPTITWQDYTTTKC